MIVEEYQRRRAQAGSIPARPSTWRHLLHLVDVLRLVPSALVPCAVLLLVSPSWAEAPPPDPAKLDYERPAGVPSCPDERYFRNFVAVRFEGLDPFTSDAPRRIAVKVRRDKRLGFVAELAMFDETGKRLGDDTVDEPTCLRVAESAARRVVSWLLPIVGPPASPIPATAPAAPSPAATPPPAPPESAEPAPEPQSPPLGTPASPAEPASTHIAPRIGVGASLDLGLASRPLVGAKIEGGIERDWWRLTVEARWVPPETPAVQNFAEGMSSVSTSLFAVGIVGCVRHAWTVVLLGCLVGEAGQERRAYGGAAYVGVQQAALYLGGGGIARLEMPLSKRFYTYVTGNILAARKLADTTSGMMTTATVGGAVGGTSVGAGLSF